jgi:hypothetical protein
LIHQSVLLQLFAVDLYGPMLTRVIDLEDAVGQGLSRIESGHKVRALNFPAGGYRS